MFPAHELRRAESGGTSEEETLDALRVAAQLYGLGQHPDGGPVVPQPLLHLCQHPDGMHPRALGVIQRQGLAKGCFCLCHMPKLQVSDTNISTPATSHNASDAGGDASNDHVASGSQHAIT